MKLNKKISIREDDGKYKMIGWLHGREFRKAIKGSVHIHRKSNAIGIDLVAYDKSILGHADKIRILDKETDMVYETSIHTFEENNFVLHHKPHRAQKFLELKFWKQYARLV